MLCSMYLHVNIKACEYVYLMLSTCGIGVKALLNYAFFHSRFGFFLRFHLHLKKASQNARKTGERGEK